MYGIFIYIWVVYGVHVGKYAIPWAFGFYEKKKWAGFFSTFCVNPRHPVIPCELFFLNPPPQHLLRFGLFWVLNRNTGFCHQVWLKDCWRWLRDGKMQSLELKAASPPMNCACTACPTLPRVYENFATDAFASPLPEIYMPVLCPTKLGMFRKKVWGGGFSVRFKLNFIKLWMWR